MNILMLSTDMKIFEEGSDVSMRLSKYGVLGDSITFLVFGAGKRRERILAPNVRAVSAGGAGRISAYIGGAFTLLSLSRAASIISSQDPFFVGALGLKVSWLRRIPFQAQLHTDCFSEAYAGESLRRRIESVIAAFVVKNAACVRAVSERVAKSARRITRKPVSVLPIFVSPPADTPHAAPAVFSMLTVSRLTPEKRVDLIIRAAAEIKEARLVIVGDGPVRAELEALANSLGVSDRVEFAGWQKPAEYYARASVYVQASRYEGYGMALVEAALSGVPIVATDAGIVGELFRNGEDILVAAGTGKGIAEEVLRMKLEPQLAERLSVSARKKAAGSLVPEDAYLRGYAAALKTCF